VAPAYDLDKAIALMTPKNEKCKAGARILKLESLVKGGSGPAAPAKEYAKADFMEVVAKPADFDGKAVEMLVAMGGVANVGSAPSTFKKETITGFTLYDKDG